MLTIALIYFTGSLIIGYCVAQLFTDGGKNEAVKNTENSIQFKYDGECERCDKPNGEKVFTFRYYNILCNKCQDKILGLD